MRKLFRKRVDDAPALEGVWQVPPRFNFARDVVEAYAADPLYPALTFVDRNGVIDRRTFTEIAREANRWAALLRSRGLAPGDRLLVFTARTPTWVAILLGALKGGFVVVPCSAGVQTGDLAWRAEDSGARLIVTDRERASAVALMDVPLDVVIAEEVATELRKTPILQPTHDTGAADVAVILYTSKAGGQMGITHTHGSTWAQRVPAEHWLEARAGDLVWCTAGPNGAESGWNLLFGPWGCGAEIVIHEGSFDAEQRLDLLQRLGVTILCQTPEEYRLLADAVPTTGPIQPGRLRHAVSLGEQADEEATNAFQDAFGIAVWDGFGQAENTILIANTRGATVSPGSIGLPTPGHDIGVIDADGTVLPAGSEGDLALHGRPPTLFAGYWNAPETTAAAFRGAWFLTGERAVCDEEGHVWLAGRAAASPRAMPEDELVEGYAAATNGSHPDPAADAVGLELPVAADRETPVGEAAALAAIEAATAEREAQDEARRRDELAAAAAAAEQAAAAARAEAEERARLEAEAREAEARAAAEREEARRREEEAAVAAAAAAAAAAAEAARLEQEQREAAEREEAKRREEEAAAAAAEAARLEQEQREATEREEATRREEAKRREKEAAAAAAAAAADAARTRTPEEPVADDFDPHEQALRREELAAAAAVAQEAAALAAARAAKARREAEEGADPSAAEAAARAAEEAEAQKLRAAAAALAAEQALRDAEAHRLKTTAAEPAPLSGRAARKAAADQRKEESRRRKEEERARKEGEKAAAEQRKREEAEARAVAKQRQNEEELKRREDARRREAEAQQRKREEAEQRAAAAEREKQAELQRQEEERRREIEEWQRAEAEKAAAEQRRRDEDAERAAAARRAKEVELRQQEVELRHLQAEARRKQEEKEARAAREAAALRARQEADERFEALQRLEAEQQAERERAVKAQQAEQQKAQQAEQQKAATPQRTAAPKPAPTAAKAQQPAAAPQATAKTARKAASPQPQATAPQAKAPQPPAAPPKPEASEKPRRHVRIRKPKGPVVEFDEFEETREDEVDTGPNQALIARLQAYGVETKAKAPEPEDAIVQEPAEKG
jgi:acetyl-CoA synthetase